MKIEAFDLLKNVLSDIKKLYWKTTLFNDSIKFRCQVCTLRFNYKNCRKTIKNLLIKCIILFVLCL